MRNYLIFGLILVLAIGGLVSYALSQEEVKDPVCGTKMKAAEAKFKSEYAKKTYYFCSADCRAKFDQAPEEYVVKKPATMSGMMTPGAVCCGMNSEMMKEVKVEKKETPEGQVVTMTSDNPQVVKKLQEMAKQCQEGMMSGQHKEMMAAHKEMMEKHMEMMKQKKEKKEMAEQKAETTAGKKEETAGKEATQTMGNMKNMEQMGQCKQMEAMGGAGHMGQGVMECQGVCLMHNENYTSTVTNIENGVRVEMKKK